jgi:hypothetical protein
LAAQPVKARAINKRGKILHFGHLEAVLPRKVALPRLSRLARRQLDDKPVTALSGLSPEADLAFLGCCLCIRQANDRSPL